MVVCRRNLALPLVCRIPASQNEQTKSPLVALSPMEVQPRPASGRVHCRVATPHTAGEGGKASTPNLPGH